MKRKTGTAEEQDSVCGTPTCISQVGSEWRPIGGIQERLTRWDGRGGGLREKASTQRTEGVKEELVRAESEKRSFSLTDPVNLRCQNLARWLKRLLLTSCETIS